MPAARSTSKHVTVNVGRSVDAQPYPSANTRTLGPVALRQQEVVGQQRLREELTGLGTQSLNVIREIQGQQNMDISPDDGLGDVVMQDDGDRTWEDVTMTDLPPLPDGMGVEFSTAIRDVIDQQQRGRYHRDTRTWRQRIQREQQNWAPRIEEMTGAYLQWKYPIDNQDAEVLDTAYDFNIQIVDIYTLAPSATIKRSEDSRSLAEALCLNGYIGNSPENPSLAIAIRTLELFRRIRLRKPSFSVEAFAKVVCDLYNMPYRRGYRVALSNAFDAYLEVLRRIDGRISTVLGRDEPDWRVKNSCPPCCYELNDEPYLRFRRMWAMDANFSLKRMKMAEGRTAADTRQFLDSDYFLRDEEISRFENEVKRQVRGPTVPGPEVPISIEEEPGDPTDGRGNDEPSGGDVVEEYGRLTGCAKNWKAAAKDEKKRMWAIFEETGEFVSACRHGLILWAADIIQSGELAKFPLATVGKAIPTLGKRSLIGYDIGCEFGTTLNNSSLGPAFRESESRCCVNAFHGYSHSYDCQKQHHPNVIEGMGIEDLEGLERLFSASNALGGVTRYMTKYRRRVFISMFFRQWDSEKYANLGNMLHDNYVQALKIITDDQPALEEAMAYLKISQADLEKWHKEEVTYFQTVGREPEYDIHRVAYVELLQKYRDICAKYADAHSAFLVATPATREAAGATYESELSATRRRETERRVLSEKREQALVELAELEAKLEITVRWTPASPEYKAAAEYTAQRDYHRALDRLQKLVVQRLFELHKMNLSFTGYKMRSHIAKALQARCKAIRNAVNTYNEAARKLTPPRPSLDWSKVSHYSFLEEFELLRGTRQDIQERPWSSDVARLTMKQDLRIKRAREEITRCNIEMRRIYTAILDEHDSFDACLESLKENMDPIYGAVAEFVALRKRVNYQIIYRFQKTQSLPGFTGNLTRGVRQGAASALNSARSALPNDIARVSDDEDDANSPSDTEETDEQTEGNIVGIIDYISDLPHRNLE